jgi:alpha-beta hydrolase superfamily lysophospholipase
MTIEIHELRVPAPGPAGQPWVAVATIYLPSALSLASGPDLFFLLPGAGYGRGYFDLPVEGFSEARYHASRGNIVVTLDYLGIGEASIPADASVEDAAFSTHAAVTHIADGLAQGSLLSGLGPVRYGALVAAGQSMGGHLLIATQAGHSTFKGIATLGSSVAGTAFPTRDGGKETDFSQADYGYGFHWPDPIPAATGEAPTDLDSLVAADAAAGLGVRTGSVPWGSDAIPSWVVGMLDQRTLRTNAAKIDRPVLLVAGERDVTRTPEEEAAPFSASPEVEHYLLAEAAHMHNFAATRERLWKRLDTFIMHVSTYDRRTQSDVLMKLMKEQQEKAEQEAAAMAQEG